MRPQPLILAIFLSLLLFSCKKKTDDYSPTPLSDYVPLSAGKYMTYRLDSTVFISFGTIPVVHSYQEKQMVDAQINDNLGRPSYRILRYTRDTSGNGPWTPAGSYFITPLRNTVEVIENNLRIVKLTLPVSQDETWKGNRYLPDEPMSALYSFSNDLDMADWDYTYAGVGETVTLNGHSYTDVVTVNGIDRSFNAPVTNQNSIGYVDYQQDRYAKGIGLIYQEFTMWEYQPPHENVPVGQTTGFGVKRTLIDHN